MNKIEVFEYDGQLYRTKNSALLQEMEDMVINMNMYHGFMFDKDKAYRNKERLIELLGELE